MKKGILFILALTTIFSCNHDSKAHHEEDTKHEHNEHQSVETSSKVDSIGIKEPNRVEYTYAQSIEGPIEQVFPLYCPVKESLWIDGWSTKAVYSKSGFIEANCVFITEGHGDGNDAIWYVTEYDTTAKHIEMLMTLPETVIMKLVIDVEALSENTTQTTVTRSLTSIGKSGDYIIENYTKEEFEKSMGKWEKAMNHYLKTGEVLKGLKGF
jgi:hypothetical protein